MCGVKDTFDLSVLPASMTPQVMAQLIECIAQVRHGSVEIKIQDAKIVQIDTIEKRRMK